MALCSHSLGQASEPNIGGERRSEALLVMLPRMLLLVVLLHVHVFWPVKGVRPPLMLRLLLPISTSATLGTQQPQPCRQRGRKTGRP